MGMRALLVRLSAGVLTRPQDVIPAEKARFVYANGLAGLFSLRKMCENDDVLTLVSTDLIAAVDAGADFISSRFAAAPSPAVVILT
jgi:hypothetical protein